MADKKKKQDGIDPAYPWTYSISSLTFEVPAQIEISDNTFPHSKTQIRRAVIRVELKRKKHREGLRVESVELIKLIEEDSGSAS